MADICRQYVLHHESGGWLGTPSGRLCIHQRTLLQVDGCRHHPLLFISLVYQDLVSAFLQATRHERQASKVHMVAYLWYHGCNILRLYWHDTILMPPSIISISCRSLRHAACYNLSASYLEAELYLGRPHGFFE